MDVAYTKDILQAGGILLYPTDTIWGLGCDACNADAVSAIYRLKNRSEDHSFIVLVDSLEMLKNYVETLPANIESILNSEQRPLTIIYPKARNLASNVIAQDGSIAIRIPNHAFCKELIRAFGKPIVSTSANISGEPAPAKFTEIAAIIKQGVGFIVDEKYDTAIETQSSKIIKINDDGSVQIIRA